MNETISINVPISHTEYNKLKKETIQLKRRINELETIIEELNILFDYFELFGLFSYIILRRYNDKT